MTDRLNDLLCRLLGHRPTTQPWHGWRVTHCRRCWLRLAVVVEREAAS